MCSCSHPLGRHTSQLSEPKISGALPRKHRSQQVEVRTLGLPHQRHPTTAPMELVAAARSGRTNDVRRLLDAEGCRVDDEGEAGGSPLWYACAGGHYQCAKLLLLRGAAVDRERDGTTPLLVACQNGRLDVCELLIERGASISTPTTTGLSALNTAARGGHADIVALLLARGFSRGAETAFAREIAKIHNHTDVVELLDVPVDADLRV